MNSYLLIIYIDGYISLFFFSSRTQHTRFSRDWSSDVCSSDLSLSVPTSRLFFTTQVGFTGGNIDRDQVTTVAQALIAGQQNVDQAAAINVNEHRYFQQEDRKSVV